MEAMLGTFQAVSTRDGEALTRHAHPYFAVAEMGVDGRGDRLFEIRFGDGLWMLATESDLVSTTEAM